MEDKALIFPGCDCTFHQTLYPSWFRKNAILRISSCMRRCLYCGKNFPSANRLRKHLSSLKYRRLNIIVEKEHAGSGGISNPSCISVSSSGFSGNEDVEFSSNSSTLLCDQLLKMIVTDFGNVFKGLSSSNLALLGDLPERTKLLWKSSTTTHPQLYTSPQCWSDRCPSTREMIRHIVQCLSGHKSSSTRSPESIFKVNYRGEVDMSVDPALAIAQLVDPDPKDPAFLTGLRLQLVDELGYRTPYALSLVAETFEESNAQVNLTPKFSFVDLHIDYGADGLSTTIGPCQKIWLLYPPTSQNLAAIRSVEGQKIKLVRVMQGLEGGIIVRTTSDDALYIPATCIHATFTLQGGCLVTKDFTTSKSLYAIASYIDYQLDRSLTEDAREICFDWFERCLDVYLTQGRVTESIQAWIRAESCLIKWASSHRRWRISVRRLWEQHVDYNNSERCICGKHESSSSLRSHLLCTHINSLLPSSQRRIY